MTKEPHTKETCTDRTCYECWKEHSAKIGRDNMTEARLGAYSTSTILNWRG